jgi:hypothetical protein
VATAFFTDRALYHGRLREMLRNEIRYTNVIDGIPGNLQLKEQKLGPMSIFGAAEYAKDGLLAITELLGRTPWFYRLVDLTAAVLLYALYKTQGCYLDEWREGVRLGAHRVGEKLYVSLEAPRPWRGRLRFDFARHRRALNLDRNYVRLNEWPEWFTLDENTLYRVTDAAGRERLWLGSELKDGLEVAAPGRWVVQAH